MNIAIVGAGIGGLGCALALAKQGFTRICIFEKDPSFYHRKQGYGLTIQQGSSALSALNLVDQFKSLDTPSSSHVLFDNEGKVIGFFGRVFHADAGKVPKNKYNLHVPRQVLREVLYKEVLSYPNEIEICWQSDLKSFSEQDGKCILDFGEGKPSCSWDVVIGADGIYSKLRELVFPTTEYPQYSLNYLGCLVVLGIVECSEPLVYERIWQTMDGTTRLFVMPYALEPYTIMWQLSFPIETVMRAREISSCKQRLKQYILKDLKLSTWHHPVPNFIEETAIDRIMATPVFDREALMEDDLSKIPRNMFLIGDALHPMSPFKGQGANQALLDAVALAKHIKSSSAHSISSLNFTKEIVHRTLPKVLASRARAFEFHSEEALSQDKALLRGIPVDLLRSVRDDPQISASNAKDLNNLILEKMKSLSIVW